MRAVYGAFLLLLFETCTTYQERDFSCPYADTDEPALLPTSVCDGISDCRAPSDADIDQDPDDESPKICAPLPYLEKKINLGARNVTSTSVYLSWSKATRHVPGHSLVLAGYIVSGKSAPHSFQNSMSGRLLSHQVQWMKPWTNYTALVRPFYTESGKPEHIYKLGPAATVAFRTHSSEPDTPGLVSVLSAKHRNVELSVIGPSTWNSDPFGLHVRWEATSELRGSEGWLDISLAPDWSVEENTVNVTLPLEGGIDYRVFVSAVGADGSGGTLRSPEMDVEVSVPLDAYEVTASAVGTSKAFVSWRSSEIVDDFKVTIYIDNGVDSGNQHTTRRIKRRGKVTSWQRVLIPGLLPWTYYVVSLQGCSAEECSDAVNATFSTPPEVLPAPSFVEVKATSASSFEVTWLFPQRDSRLYDGFRVRYCTQNVGSCFLVYTNENILIADGLAPQTTVNVYVAADYKNAHGKRQRGPEATASVTTWSIVPVVTVKPEGGIEDGSGSYLLSWTCVNSSVDYFEYNIGYSGLWTTCNDSAKCEAIVENDVDTTFSSGYIKLNHHEQYIPSVVVVRGCNNHGCGEASSANVHWHSRGPSPLAWVMYSSQGNSAVVQWSLPDQSEYDGVDITWNCNGSKPFTYNHCVPKQLSANGYNPYRRVHYNEYSKKAHIKGLPTQAENCAFYASAYKDEEERRYYSLPVQATEE